MTNYLVIVEGQDMEMDLLREVFPRFLPGYHIESKIYDKNGMEELRITFDQNGENTIYLIKPKHNTLNQIVSSLKEDPDVYAFAEFFSEGVPNPDMFEQIFLLFDIDHTTPENLEFALDYFSDEYEQGLLLVSSPAIEALCDEDLTFFLESGKRIRTVYKPKIRNRLIEKGLLYPTASTKEYMLKVADPARLIKEAFIRCLNHYGDDSFFKDHSRLFKNGDLPIVADEGTSFPFVCSLIYIMFGAILKADMDLHPNDRLMNLFQSALGE